MPRLVDRCAPTQVIGHAHLAGQQSLLKITPGQDALFAPHLTPDLADNTFDVGACSTCRQQCQRSEDIMWLVLDIGHCGAPFPWSDFGRQLFSGAAAELGPSPSVDAGDE
ncbi:hypothetical protein [Pararhizobium gei]|uniref:hypothetical protein n=1 Tax=Pararhizobium gei TaxID=1395951 RepID=UPI0023DC740A|nr:hypothetical protein [Rhizobium gei]